MYNEYFGFKEPPFSIAPDPRYLYMTAQHREALAHLVYGLNSEGGCILLTGEVGTGKTTICRCLLEQIPEKVNVALLLNPKVNEIELLETICDELNISYPEKYNSVKTYTDRIYNTLIENNRKNESTVLIIDEAQNLDNTVLEQLRLLTNLETDQRKLLQIIILGQPELLDILAKSEMRQLAQRITARYHLEPLSKNNLKAYLDHRLAVAGQNISIFPEKSINLLYKLTKGIPRLINVIADRALLGAYVENQHSVSPEILSKAASEVFGELKNVESKRKKKRWFLPAAAIMGIAALSTILYFNFKQPLLSFSKALFPVNTKQDIKSTTTADSNDDAIASINTSDKVKHDKEDQKNSTPAVFANDNVNNSNPTTVAKNTINTFDHTLNTSSNSLSSSFDILFKLWGAEYIRKSSITGCEQAKNYSLLCLHRSGNLNTLKKLNRPTVLRMTSPEGRRRYVTISKVNQDTATIYSGGKAFKLPTHQLENYWSGQFILLWKTPTEYTATISPGDNHKIVGWLKNLFKDTDATATGNLYDEELATKVRAFQKEHNLDADGIIGPITIIHLNSQTGDNIPKLI